MEPTPSLTAPARPAPSVEQAWLSLVQAQVRTALAEALVLPDEGRLDEGWSQALGQLRGLVARPAQRLRPALLLAGYCLARGSTTVPPGLWRFVAGLELMHTCRHVHAEVMESGRGGECAGVRAARGGAPLHARLAPEPTGAHLAVVVGDHLFARAMEVMMEAEVPGALEAAQYCLRLERTTAAGHFRQEQGGVLAEQGGVWRAFRLAQLRAVREGLASALVCGAMLAGAEDGLRLLLARVG